MEILNFNTQSYDTEAQMQKNIDAYARHARKDGNAAVQVCVRVGPAEHGKDIILAVYKPYEATHVCGPVDRRPS